jgi:cytochrome c peroxidase
MKSKHRLVVLCLLFAACSFYIISAKSYKAVFYTEWSRGLPSYIKDPVYGDNSNSFSQGKIELGRYLFYDRRLSVNKSKSCASCHDPKFSFTDGYRRSIGALGDLHQRNSSPLINLIFKKYLTDAVWMECTATEMIRHGH